MKLLKTLIITVFFSILGASAMGQGEITGVVFDDSNGDGQVSDGESVTPGTEVVLVDSEGNAVGSATTGEDGSYTIQGVGVGDYYLQFTYPNGIVVRTASFSFDGTSYAFNAPVLTSPPGAFGSSPNLNLSTPANTVNPDATPFKPN